MRNFNWIPENCSGDDMNSHTCSICGYPRLDLPARDPETGAPSFDICPSCGCEIGYDDVTQQEKERYRRNWVDQGAIWFQAELKPLEWDLRDQLNNIGINLEDLI
jgi:hypothetical protein